jgi:hypothetical protein
MAKTSKKPKLTEEEKDLVEQRFQQFRDQALRQWYEQAHGNDSLLKAAAQARLQLQIWLREKRREIETQRHQRDECKAKGDKNGQDIARKKMKHAQIAMAMHMNMSRQGIPPATAAKAVRKWAKKTHTLEEILGDRVLDKKTEFGIVRDDLRGSVADEEEGGGMPLEENVENMQPEAKDAGITLDNVDKVDDLAECMPDPTSIWTQHALHMQQRYRCTEIPDFSVETKLAFQKKVFDQHVDRVRQLCKAAENTAAIDTNSQSAVREGVSTSWNSVLVTTTFSEHSLWELTSPMLWRYFEGGLSWDYPHWVPRGLMRIQTVSKSSHIYFEFGVRTFSTQRIFIPATVSTNTLVFPAHCHQTGANIDIQIVFLAQAFVRVHFPVVGIIQPDIGCKDLPTEAVELTGFWMGPVE